MLLSVAGTEVPIDIVADNDDDGETAAGGRLAHLLQILVSLELSIQLVYALYDGGVDKAYPRL